MTQYIPKTETFSGSGCSGSDGANQKLNNQQYACATVGLDQWSSVCLERNRRNKQY